MNHAVWIHRDLSEWLQSREEPHLQPRVRHDLLELAARGHTRRIKSVSGTNRGWLRTPLGGGSACHFYLWWLPPSVQEAGDGKTPTIRVRAVRHHDRTDEPLDPGDLTQYVRWSARELVEVPDEDLPFTEGQLRLARGRSEVRVLRGLPGTGKTSGLLFGAVRFVGTPILYLTKNWRLVREAAGFLEAYGLDGSQTRVLSFEELFDRLESLPPDRLRGAGRLERLEEVVKQEFHAELGAWRSHLPELYAEIYGHLLGRSLPIPFRGRAPSSGTLMDPVDYEAYRSPQIGSRLAHRVSEVGRILDQSGVLASLFPAPVAAGLAMSRLAAGECALDDFTEVTAILVDEVQDLTIRELCFLVRFWSDLASGETGRRPALLLAGDESQTVAPTDFSWGELSDLIHREQGGRIDHELDVNLRSPSSLVAVVSRSWGLYGHLGKKARPRGIGRVPARPEDMGGRIFQVTCRDEAELDQVTRAVCGMPLGVVLWPGDSLPDEIKIRCSASDEFLPAPAVKGLEFQTVALLDAGKHLAAIEEGAMLMDESPGALGIRMGADRLRVCLSRATENLVLVDLRPGDASRQAIERLVGDMAEEMSSPEFCAWIQALERDAVEAIQVLTDTAEALLEDHPRLALRRSRSALAEIERALERPELWDLERRLRILVGVSAALVALDENRTESGKDRSCYVMEAMEALRQAGLEDQARTVPAIYQVRLSGTGLETSIAAIETILEQMDELHPSLRVRCLDSLILWCHRKGEEKPRWNEIDRTWVTAVLDQLQRRVGAERPMVLPSMERIRHGLALMPGAALSHEDQIRSDWAGAIGEGLNEMWRNSFKQAEKCLRRARRLAHELKAPDRLAYTMIQFGSLNLRRGLFAQAVKDLESALPSMEKAAGRFCSPVLEAKSDLARALMMLRQEERAEPVLRDLLVRLEDLYGPDHEDMVQPLFWLAQVREIQGDLDEGLRCLSRAVDFCDEFGTPIGVNYEEIIHNYMRIFHRSGEPENAEIVRKALCRVDPRLEELKAELEGALVPELIEKLLFGEPGDHHHIEAALKQRDETVVLDQLLSRLASITRTDIDAAMEASPGEGGRYFALSLQTAAAQLARRTGQLLGKMDARALDRLIRHLGAKDPVQRAFTCHLIGGNFMYIGRQQAAIVALPLAGLLTDPVPEVREAAAEALGSCIKPPTRIVEALLNATGDPVSGVARRAMLSLAMCEELGEIFIPRLRTLLGDPDAGTRLLALRGLDLYHEAARCALPEVLKRFDDPDAAVRAMAVDAAESIAEPEEIISEIGRALEDPDVLVRKAACLALQDMGRCGESLLEKLEEIITSCEDEEEDEEVSMNARLARNAILSDLHDPEWLRGVKDAL